jgi:hypothetical protein
MAGIRIDEKGAVADDRPCHDHPTWKGPCSQERHELLLDGGPADRDGMPPRSCWERICYLLAWTRFRQGGIYCACCQSKLAEWPPAAWIKKY